MILMLKDSFFTYLRFERNYSQATVDSYRTDIVQFEDFLKGEIDENRALEAADAAMIRQWEMSLLECGYSPSSVNRKLSSLRAFYRYLLKRQAIRVNPMQKVVGPKEKKRLPCFLRESEMDALLDEMAQEEGFIPCRDRLVVEMFYVTGIRRAELVALDDEDVDVVSCQLKVTGKRNKQRIVPFGAELKKLIVDYRGMRGAAVPAVSPAFFVSPKGERLRADQVYGLVKKNLAKVTTLKKTSPHVLRHTFATVMLNNGAGIESVKELLGHDSLSTTGIYAHTTFEELKKVYKQAHPRA